MIIADLEPDLTQTKPPRWCQLATRFPGPMHGGKGSQEFDSHLLAREAWGDRAAGENSCFAAFAYLWRRFGPPVMGCDDHKELCSYVIKTPMPGVLLDLGLNGMSINYAVGYLATEAIVQSFHEPRLAWIDRMDEWAAANGFENVYSLSDNDRDKDAYQRALDAVGPCPLFDRAAWRVNEGPAGDMNRAIYATLRELLRPIYIRDVAIDLFGRTRASWKFPAKPSKYAGLGVPRKGMDELLKVG